MANSERERAMRISRILEDEVFLAVVKETGEQITSEVMNPASTDETRAKALAEYHGLLRVMRRLREAEAILGLEEED